MLLTDFNAVFHLFTVFNFAYIASDNFLKTIEESIFKSSKKIDEMIHEIKNKVDLTKESLYQLNPEVGDGITTQAKLDPLIDEHKKIEEDFIAKTQTIEANKKSIYSTTNFVEFCIYGALYSLTILLISAFHHKDDNNLLNETICVFNILSLIILIFMTCISTFTFIKQREIGSMRMIKIFCTVAALVAIFYNKNTQACPYESGLNNFVLITSILIPIYHFVIYFLRSLYIRYLLESSTRKTLDGFADRLYNLNLGLEKYTEGLTFMKEILPPKNDGP